MNGKIIGRHNVSADSSTEKLWNWKNIRFWKIFDPWYFRRVVVRKSTKTVEISWKLCQNIAFWNVLVNVNCMNKFWKLKFQTFSKESFITATLQKSMNIKWFGRSPKVHCNGIWEKLNLVFSFSQLTKIKNIELFWISAEKKQKITVCRRNWISWVNETILVVGTFTIFR